MKSLTLSVFVMAIVLTFGIGSASAQMNDGNPMVGGAAMYKTKDIVDNAVNSKDHTTLVAAVKAVGLNMARLFIFIKWTKSNYIIFSNPSYSSNSF